MSGKIGSLNSNFIFCHLTAVSCFKVWRLNTNKKVLECQHHRRGFYFAPIPLFPEQKYLYKFLNVEISSVLFKTGSFRFTKDQTERTFDVKIPHITDMNRCVYF